MQKNIAMLKKHWNTGQCRVSNGGIGIPGPEDHYSNPPTVSFYHLFHFTPLLSLLLALIAGFPFSSLSITTTTVPTQRRGRGWEYGVSHNRGHSTLPNRPRGRGPGRSSSGRQRDGMLPIVSFPNIPCSFNNFPSLSGFISMTTVWHPCRDKTL